MNQTECFSLFKGRRLRATKLDQCGRIVYGPCSQVVVGGSAFVSVAMTDEIKEGTTYEREGADGELCVSERGCDQRKWINVEYTFCRVDPSLVTLLNPNWMSLLDYKGDKIGWAETYTLQCDTGVGLELWSDVSGVDTCDDPNALASYGYILLPQVVGGRIGDLTVENDVVNFVLTGRTKKKAKWGTGPYNVMLNGPLANPVPGPLLVPVGADEPRRIFVTTVAPPEATCGCMPLSAPDGPQLTVVEDTTDTTGMTAKATTTTATGTIRINWGDGSPEETLPSGAVGLTHQYAQAGTYNIQVFNQSTPLKPTVAQITVPFGDDTSALTVAWAHGPLSTDDGLFSWTQTTPSTAVAARVLRPDGTYEPVRPFTGGNSVTLVDTTRWLTTGTWTVQLQDAGGLTVGQGTFVVAAPAVLTGSFVAPRTWEWTEVVGAAVEARVLEPDGDAVPGTSDVPDQEFVAVGTYTPAPGNYVLQLRNANFVVINEDSVTVP